MKSKLFAVLTLTLLAAFHIFLSTAHAQNTTFTYQGRVTDNGTNFTGTGQFQFALVTSTNFNHTATAAANAPSGGFITGYVVTGGGSGYVTAPAVTVFGGGGAMAAATANLTGGVVTSLTVNNPGNGTYTNTPLVTIAPPPPNISYVSYWSNDGTSSGGSEPAAAVNLDVSNGLFTVVVGDPTIPNMSAIGAVLFNQPNLQLRIWFNDGVNGFIALGPVQNLTPTPYATTAGGVPGLTVQNNTNGAPDLIQGAANNYVSSAVIGATISGGGAINYLGVAYSNKVTAVFGTVGGGRGNTASGNSTTVGGGNGNAANGDYSVVAGGGLNGAGALYSVISGGYDNIDQLPYATIGGGLLNNAQGTNSTIGGGDQNYAGGTDATVAGGAFNDAFDDFSTVGGGYGNVASGVGATVAGGGNDGQGDVAGNTASGAASFIGGGLANIAGDYSSVGGGDYNNASGIEATIAGGGSNMATNEDTFVGGGEGNIAGGTYSTVCGGTANIARGEVATVGGGENNTASGLNATVPGGSGNLASGINSFAAGKNASATANYSFVWSDGTVPVGTPVANQVYFYDSGGFAIFTSKTAGVYLTAGGTSWMTLSDRNAKKNFQAVDYQAVLARLAQVPIQQWNYKWEEDSAVPNIGPMAQDFKHAFYPGRDDKGISTLEFDGVELAAIQGLNQKLNEKDVQIQNLSRKLDELQALVQQLAARK
jgi:hypothetical protein